MTNTIYSTKETFKLSRLDLPIEKFLDILLKNIKVDHSTGCWLWTGYKNSKGYGSTQTTIITKDGTVNKRFLLHRVSYAIMYKQDPVGMCVCHHCDMPSCINPSHLFLGTIGDNNRDAFNKGRNKKVGVYPKQGIDNPRARYNEEQIRQMRKLYKNGVPIKELQVQFGGTRGGIHAIVTYVNWKHVVDEVGGTGLEPVTASL